MLSFDNRLTFQLIFTSISILFVFHIFNDLDLDSHYFININAVEIANDDGKERIDLNYIFDSNEYFEEDNIPQTNNNINNHKNNQMKQSGEQVYNQIDKDESSSSSNDNNNKKFEFTSTESISSDDKSDYVTFNTRINLQNIEKTGMLRLVGYINGQSFKEDIQLSEVASTTKNLDVKFNALKDTGLVSLGTADEFFTCVYHIQDIKKEENSILYFDCNEGDVQDSDGKNTIRLFKPSSMVYSESKAFYDERQQQQGQSREEISKPINDNGDDDDKVLLKIISPLSDRKNTKELKIAAMVRGQIQTETIKDVQKELDKGNGEDTITTTFTFDRNTDIGKIQIGDRFHACVSSDDLNPPEGQECEKRLVKKFNSPNPLPAR